MMAQHPEHAKPARRERRRRLDRAALDLWIAAGIVLAGGSLFVTMDAIEWLSPAALRWEVIELDDVLLTLCLAAAVASWFAFRRWSDSTRQLAELRRAAEERAFYLERLEELSSQLLQAEQRERDRLAEVLHDEIGQTLYACQLKLELLASANRFTGAAAGGNSARDLLAQASELTSAAMTQARDLSIQLSPPALHDLGIAEAIEALLPRLQERYGLRMRFDPGPAWDSIPRRWYGPVFHSVSELVVNAAKHAGASCVALSAKLGADGDVRVIVSDDGDGFDARARSSGFGLFSIERRMACMNGALEIESEPARGTTAMLRLSCRA
jgi:signal transduction histidine kinase